MKLYEVYVQIYSYYATKYPKVAVQFQCGSFFEMYDLVAESKTNVAEICKIINIEFKPRADGTSLMSGVPLASYEKYSNILLRHGYTVIKVEQVSQDFVELDNHFIIPAADGKRRCVKEILSPSLNFDSELQTNNVISLFIEKYTNDLIQISAAIHDTLRSESIYIIDFDAVSNDTAFSIDSAIEFIIKNNPVEVMIVTKNGQSVKDIVKKLGINPDIITMLDVQQLRVKSELISVSAILTYLEDKLISTSDLKIVAYEIENRLELSSTAINQLDVNLLYKIINQTQTAMGSRLLYSRLTSPFTDPNVIQDIYNKSQEMTDFENVKLELKDQIDYDKMLRKLSLGKFKNKDLKILNSSMSSLNLLRDMTKPIVKYIDDHFNLDSDRMFKVGVHDNVDYLYESKLEAENNITKFQEAIQKHIPKLENFKFSKDGLGVQVSETRYKILKKEYPSWKFTPYLKEWIVSNNDIAIALDRKSKVEKEIKNLEDYYFADWLKEFYNLFHVAIQIFSNSVAELDFQQNSCYLKKKYRLNYATLTDQHELSITGLRHLIIETIDESKIYVTNDLKLDLDTTGYVIYGVNSSGKSSYLKASGLAVILAQAGLPVAASLMQFKPIRRIMTRIYSGDSIEKGQSSFINEALEIKSILLRANTSTMILADEVSSGTETDSSSRLNLALFKWLKDRNCFFVATTHLHEISTNLKKIEKIKVFHFKVEFIDGVAVFKRILQEGSGTDRYGIVICSNLKFPKEFIESCMEIDMKPNVVKKSKYNSKKIVYECEFCNYKPVKVTDKELDVHHKDFQCQADEDGYIDNHSVHRLSNLITLCKPCHIKVHQGILEYQVQETISGTKYIVKEKERKYLSNL